MKDLDFAALLCSRLCHDLISPVGAISNGMEILVDEDDEMMRAEVMKLLDSSVSQTSNRLKFYRLAFGAAGGIGAQVPIRDARNASIALFEGTPVNIEFNSELGELNKNGVKLLLNMILVASEGLVRGGELNVNVTETEGVITLKIDVKAERIIFQDKSRLTICGENKEIEGDPKLAPAYLAANVASDLGGEILYNSPDENSFNLQVKI